MVGDVTGHGIGPALVAAECRALVRATVAQTQDMPRLAGRLREALETHPAAHAVLLAGHGMYTWGKSVDEAARHVEIVEFLLEVVGRQESRSWPQ